MLENLWLSFQTVIPIVILVAVGMFLKKINLLPEEFYSGADKFVFKVALPCMIFLEVAGATIDESAGYLGLMLYVAPMICVLCLVYSLISPFFIKDKRKLGASVQSMFRSNAAILGSVLLSNVFPDEERTKAALAAYAIVMPFVILAYNALSVVVLTVFMPVEEGEEKHKFGMKDMKRILIDTVKNPLIIGVVCGLPFMFAGITLPVIVTKTMGYLSNTVTALALISLGAGFSFKSLKGNLKLASAVTFIKIVFQPLLGVAIGYLLGFSGLELLVAFIVFGTPAAVSSYIMAKNMKSDYELAGQILLLSTVFCILTVFLGVFAMRCLGWI